MFTVAALVGMIAALVWSKETKDIVIDEVVD